jgi:hypothetical protein
MARRRMRERIRAYRRRRALVAAGGAFAVALSTAVSLASFTGVDLAGAAVQRAQSFLELMHQRSPGKRTEAHLTKFRRAQHHVLAERAPELPAIVVPQYVPDVGLVAPPLLVPAA